MIKSPTNSYNIIFSIIYTLIKHSCTSFKVVSESDSCISKDLFFWCMYGSCLIR